MTKKDYQAFARMIYGLKENDKTNSYPQGYIPIDGLIDELGTIFLKDNSRFDFARFNEACHTGKCKGMKE